MKNGESNTRRLRGKIWGDSLVNKLPSVSKKRRKRQASKVRRGQGRDSLMRDDSQ